MSDVNANIGIHFDTATALAELRRLQAGLAKFNQSLVEGNVAAANAQKGLNAQLIQSINSTGKFVASQKAVSSSTLAFTTALEKNKLSLKDYFRYSAAAATANTKVLSGMFAQERQIINRARKDRVKALQSQYIQLAKANGGLVEALKIMPAHLMSVNGKFTELGTRVQYAAQRQQILNKLIQQGSTQLLNFGKNTQWAGRQLMVGLTIPLSMLGSYAAQAFRELETETVKFKRVYGDMFTNDAQVDKAVENIQTLGKEYTKYGVALKDTMKMAADAAAAGFQGQALQEQVAQASKLAILGQIDQQQALETTISLQNAFGISTDELAKKIDFLNAVENQTVVSLDDITTAIPKVAPVIQSLGGSVEDLAFFLTAMKEGGVNASEGANALKSGLASLINPTKAASAMLGDLGINITGIVEANSGNLRNTVVAFAQALDTLDPLNRARAIEKLFGKFQFARMSTLFQNVTKDGSQASRALQLAGASMESLAILSQREMKKVEDSVGTKFQAAIEQFKKDIMPIGKSFLEAVTPVIKVVGGLLEKFNNLGDGSKKFITIMTALLGFIGPVALMAFGLLANGIANLIKLFGMMRNGVAKLNGSNKVLGGGFDYLTQQEIENLAQSNALHTSHKSLISIFDVEANSVNMLARAYANAGSQARTLASAAPGFFTNPKAAVSKIPTGVRRFADGTDAVPGTGNKDTVLSVLTPGEAVIPAKAAQNKDNKPIIASLIKEGRGFNSGTEGVGVNTSASNVQAGIDRKRAVDKLMLELIREFAKPEVSSESKERWRAQRKKIYTKMLAEFDYDSESSQLVPKGSKKPVPNTELAKRALYQFGVVPRVDGGKLDYVAGYSQSSNPAGKKFGDVSKLFEKFKVGGRGSGDIRTHNPGAYRALQAALKEEMAINQSRAGMQDKMVRDLYRLAPGANPKQVADFFKLHASHLEQTIDPATGKAADPTKSAKWQNGKVVYDFAGLNNYLNNTKRFNDLVEWNKKNNYALFPQSEEASYKKAIAETISSKKHPVTLEQGQQLHRLTALELRAHELMEKNMGDAKLGRIVNPSTKWRASILSELLNRRNKSTYYTDLQKYGRIVDLAASQKVGLVSKTEAFVDAKNGKLVPVNSQTATPVQTGGRAKGAGTTGDRFKPKSQYAGMPVVPVTSRGGVTYRGRATEDAFSTLSKAAQGRIKQAEVRQLSLLTKRNNLTQKEIDNAMTSLRKRKVAEELNRAAQHQSTMAKQNEAKIAAQNAADAKQTARDQRKMAQAARAEKVGRVSGGVSAALGTAGMAAMMTGNQGMGMGLMGASAVAGMAPMLTNPVAAAATALAGVALFAWKLNNDLKQATKDGVKLGNAMSMSAQDITSLSEIAGTVSATDEAAMKRKNSLANANAETRKFGQNVMGSEFGKQLLADVQTQAESGQSVQQIGEGIAVSLSNAILQGVVSPEQARSISMAMGEELKSYEIPAIISGELTSLFGPNGENLFTDPIAVTLAVQEKSQQKVKDTFEAAKAGQRNTKTAGNAAAMAGGVAAVAAGAMAIAAPNFWNPVGWAAAAAGVAAMGWALWDQNKIQAENNKLSAAAIQLGLTELQNNQNLVDSVNKEFDEKLKIAKTSEEIAKIESDRQDALDKVNAKNEEALDYLIAQKDALDPGVFQDAINAQVDTMYKEGPMKVFADQAKTALSGMGESSFKTMLQIEFASGGLDPLTVSRLVTLASTNADIATKFDLIVGEQGMTQANQMIQYLMKAGATDETIGVMLDYSKGKSKEEFDSDMEAINTLANMQSKYGITVDINVDGKDKIEAVKSITESLDKEKGTSLTKERVAELAKTDARYQQLLDNWSTLVGSADSITKTMVIDFVASGDTNVVDAYLADKGITIPAFLSPQAQDAAKKSYLPEASAWNVGNGKDSKTGGVLPPVTPPSGPGGDRDTTFDDILKRLKNVRLASINAMGGINALRKAINQPLKKGGIADAFRGIEQQMIAKNFNPQFMDYITGLDPETQKKFMTTDKKGNIQLTKDGKTMQKAFDKAIIGEFNAGQQKTIKNYQYMETATKKLAALGMSNSQIQSVLADEAYTAAIATGKITDAELKTNNALVIQEELRRKIKDQLTAGREAIQRRDELNRAPEVQTFLKDQGMSDTAIFSVLKDPQTLSNVIAAMDNFKNGAKGAKAELDNIIGGLNAINGNKNLELSKTSTPLEKVQRGYNAAQQMFEANRQVLENTVTLGGTDKYSNKTMSQMEKLMSENESQIRIEQGSLSAIQSRVDAVQTQIDRKQQEISRLYDRKIEDYNRTMGDLQRQIELKFERPIKTLQDESSALSHDLDLIGRKEEDINKAYDAKVQALEEVSRINQEIISQQSQQLDLADALSQGDIAAAARAAQEMRASSASAYSAKQSEVLQASRQTALAGVRSGSGQSRIQIEARQLAIADKIYALENDPAKIGLQNNIQVIQDEIYATEALRTNELLKIRTLEDEIYKITVNELQPQQDKVTKLVNQNAELQLQYDKLTAIVSKQDDGFKVAGMTRGEWDRMLAAATAMDKTLQEEVNAALADVAGISSTIATDWDSIKKAYEALVDKTITITYKVVGNPNGGGGGGTVTLPATTQNLVTKSPLVEANKDYFLNQVIPHINDGTATGSEALDYAVAVNQMRGTRGALVEMATGGLVPKFFASGGYAHGTDTVPAMLTPGEFVMTKYAVDHFGANTMKSINNGKMPGDSVYNYSVNVNVRSDSNPQEIARTVMDTIKRVESKSIRGGKI